MYSFTTNGAYRKTRKVIDITNMILTVVMVGLFVMMLFMSSIREYLFSAIFLAGGIINLGTAAKLLINKKKIGGIVLSVIAVFLFVMTAISLVIAINNI